MIVYKISYNNLGNWETLKEFDGINDIECISIQSALKIISLCINHRFAEYPFSIGDYELLSSEGIKYKVDFGGTILEKF